jgi:protein SCO1/2
MGITRRRFGLSALLCVLFLVGSSACSAATDASETAWAGYERTPTPIVGQEMLPAVSADGQESDFRFQAADGEVLVVYFGFTSCPDVCPTTLADLGRVVQNLGDDGQRVGVAMVTIDPEVDTPELLNGYVRAFVPATSDVVAIRTTDDAELRPVADAFGVAYGRDETDTVFHTASLFAVDDEGQLRLTWPFGVSTDDLEADLARLLEET